MASEKEISPDLTAELESLLQKACGQHRDFLQSHQPAVEAAICRLNRRALADRQMKPARHGWSRALRAAVFLLALGGALQIMHYFLSYNAARTLQMTAIFQQGEPRFRQGKHGAWQKLALGNKLESPFIIETGPTDSVKISLSRGSQEAHLLVIEPGSTVFFAGSDGSSAEIYLEHGSVLSRVGKLQKSEDFRVITPAVVAGVRGTSFLVSYDAAASQPATVAVWDGKVAVGRPAQESSVFASLKNGQLPESQTPPQLAASQPAAETLVSAGEVLAAAGSWEKSALNAEQYSSLFLEAESDFDLLQKNPGLGSLEKAREAASRVEPSELVSSGQLFKAQPLVLADHLYTLTRENLLQAFRIIDQKPVLQWQIPLAGNVDAAPVLAGDKLLLCNHLGLLQAIDRHSGQLLWQVETGITLVFGNQPVVADLSGKELLVLAGLPGKIVVLDLASRQIIWQQNTGSSIVARPLVTSAQSVVAASENGRVDCFDLASGQTIWSFETGRRVAAASPLEFEKMVVVAADNANVYFLDLHHGSRIFTFYSKAPLAVTPVASGPYLALLNRKAELWVVDDSFRIHWQRKFAADSADLRLINDKGMFYLTEENKISGIDARRGETIRVWTMPDKISGLDVHAGHLTVTMQKGQIWSK